VTKKPETFADRLQRLMDEHDPPLGIKELADMLDTSYEHARKMVRGLTVPSHFIVGAIAQLFGVDASELNEVAKLDSFHRKFGEGTPTPVFNSEVAPFASAWSVLTEGQKTQLLTLLKQFVSANARKAKQ
jgi:hypothetical protein